MKSTKNRLSPISSSKKHQKWSFRKVLFTQKRGLNSPLSSFSELLKNKKKGWSLIKQVLPYRAVHLLLNHLGKRRLCQSPGKGRLVHWPWRTCSLKSGAPFVLSLVLGYSMLAILHCQRLVLPNDDALDTIELILLLLLSSFFDAFFWIESLLISKILNEKDQ